ncbi:hypothetical protein OB2597_05830 [Pseudooceanicola batsensis HTCC2597]|uniref:PRC-barrel domain-containing protein n=1 Tax=Pseudooceanicola batsensis (strain ATCC BAA-863 / DSM 15984 / KCTC 12145 / HTCC2597) TaxID=252305 RepID=A3TT01_PSEBH|nr:PRC-barrel domain-containing protein [Pseudooceanicola batsensis]EAQ04778.1 hypothetical protein OB2597_05830 [Pseudooceanicola batsensis HTCC2597]
MTNLKTLLMSGVAVISLAAPAAAQSVDTSNIGSSDVDSTASTYGVDTQFDGSTSADAEADTATDELNTSTTANAEIDAATDDADTTASADAGSDAATDEFDTDATADAGTDAGTNANASGSASVDTQTAQDDSQMDDGSATADAATGMNAETDLADDATDTDITNDTTADTGTTDMAENDAGLTGGASSETTAGTLIGLDVASSAGESIGEIDDVVEINGETMAVVGVGGFFGLGEHNVALPVTELMYDGDTITARGYTSEQLESMAEYNDETATSLESDATVSLGRS